jgi:hypothetical protein
LHVGYGAAFQQIDDEPDERSVVVIAGDGVDKTFQSQPVAGGLFG